MRNIVATGLATGLVTVLAACALKNQGQKLVEVPSASVAFNGNRYGVELRLPPEYDRDNVTAFGLEAHDSNIKPYSIIAVRKKSGELVYIRIEETREKTGPNTIEVNGCESGDKRYDPLTAALIKAVQEITDETTTMNLRACSLQEVAGVRPALNQAYAKLPEEFR